VLAVLAILSLMVGAVILNWPASRSDMDQQTDRLTIQLDRFIADGAVSGEIRALGLTREAVRLLRYDGAGWDQMTEQTWPQAGRVQLHLNGQLTDLPETAPLRLLFEPYGAVPDFRLTFRGDDGDYDLTTNEKGRIVRTVTR
jgi:hypothetical protein